MAPCAAPRNVFCWNFATVLLVVASSAVGIVVLLKSSFVLASPDYMDAVVERCKSSEGGILEACACHYLELWTRASGGSVYDETCFVRNLFVGAAAVSAHYVAAAAILLLGGIVAGRHVLYIPWMVVQVFLFLILMGLAFSEVGFDGVAWEWNAFPAVAGLAALVVAELAVVVAAFAQARTAKRRREEEHQLDERLHFDYIRFN